MIENDDVFDAMTDRRCRLLLLQLLDYDPLPVAGLTGAAREMADAHEGLLHERLNGSGELPRADDDLLRMHTIHLPELVEYGFVEWDREANLVTKGPRFGEIRPLLELIDGRTAGPPATRRAFTFRK